MDSRRLLSGLSSRLCPSEDAHRAFLLGDLPDLEADAIASHLEQCPVCEERSQRIDGSTDAVVSALRQAITPASTLGARPAAGNPSPLRYISGHEVLGEVGRGGMGVVYKARQVKLNRLVALKMILAGPFAHSEELLRFQVEGETLAKLSHPGIVRIHEIGQADGRPFFTMEWVEGGTLADRLVDTPLTPMAAAALVEQLARAVHYAHDNGIVHRDLKPANILLAVGTLDAKVTDFGLAKGTERPSNLTVTGTVVGTPAYMAPEQARGDRLVGPAADVYSLGAILYELLSGRPPFPLPQRGAKSPAEILSEVISAEPMPLRRVRPGIPRDLATVCLRCLEKLPGARYASARELAEDLERFRKGEAVKARSTGELRRAWKWAKRRPVVAGLLAAVAASLLLGALVSTRYAMLAEWSADQAVKNERVARAAERESQRGIARADFHEGRRLAEAGRVGEGMHWMLAALRQVPDEEIDQPFREVIRQNLDGWSSRLHRLRHTIVTPDEVMCVSFNRDGRRFAVGGHDKSVRVFDADTGVQIGTTQMVECRVHAIAFSPDDTKLAVGGAASYQTNEHSRVGLIDLSTGKVVTAKIPDDIPVGAIAFADDGKAFCVGATTFENVGGAYLCDATTGEQIKHVPLPTDGTRQCLVAPGPAGFNLIAFDEGKPLRGAAIRDGAVTEWVELERPAKIPGFRMLGPDRLIVVGLDGVGGIRGYRLPDGTPTDDHRRRGTDIGFATSPDGRFWLAGTLHRNDPVAGPLRLVDSRSGVTHALLGPDDTYDRAVFSPDGRRLLASGRGGTVRVWDLALPAPRIIEENPAVKRLTFLDAAFSRDRGTVAFAAERAVRIARAGRPDEAADVFGDLAAITEDGGRVAVRLSGNTVRVLYAADRRTASLASGRSLGIRSLALDAVGDSLAAGGYGVKVNLWTPATGALREPELMQTDIVFALRFSPDGRRLAVSTFNDHSRVHGARLWDVASGMRVGDELITGSVRPAGITFHPDGSRLYTIGTGGVRCWDTADGREILPRLTHAGGASVLTFRPDRRVLATGSPTGQVRFWDVDRGAAIGAPLPGTSPVTCLEYHADGRWLAVGYFDGTARIWDTLTGEPTGPPVAQPGPILGVAFPPGTGALRTAASDGRVRDWPLPTIFAGDLAALADDLSGWTGVRLDAQRVMSLADKGAEPRRVPAMSEPEWNDAMALHAEQAGDPDAARWHLDRRIAADPGDGGRFLRRARTASSVGRFDEAEADYRRAPPESLLEWHRRRANECRGAEDWTGALWYLDRVLAATPTDWQVHMARSDVLRRKGEPAEAEAEMLKAVDRGAEPWYLQVVMEERLDGKRWPEAAAVFKRVMRKPASAERAFQAAVAYLSAGDAAAYRELCARFDGHLNAKTPALLAQLLCTTAALGPEAVPDHAKLIAACERALGQVGSAPSSVRHAHLSTLGGLHVRAGQWKKGVDRLTEALAEKPSDAQAVPTWTFLALAHHHLGDTATAAKWLSQAKVAAEDLDTRDFWNTTASRMLLAEVERTVAGKK